MQEPKSLIEGLSILRDQVVVSQRDAIIKEKQEFDEKTEKERFKLTKDVMSQIQKRKDNKYIAFKLPKYADKNIKHTILKEICQTFSGNAKLYSITKKDRKTYNGTYIPSQHNVWNNMNDLNTWVIIDNRRPESVTRAISIPSTDLKKALK
jgi:hypothetical protein